MFRLNKRANIFDCFAGTTFTSTAATVFPVGKGEKVAKQDIIAVNQTAGAQDALIAFVQIMCKRFFTSDQELYVETHEKKDDKQPNTALVNGDYGGITRRALTSNEYIAPYMGKADDLKSDAEKWEIVIVRPNIEHNMLAAVLGRGGSEDLGSTFWGQTELSCYDDSMHGVWGMSYKYHERAIVTNEKNLIRLFDVAYDGYNGEFWVCFGCLVGQWSDMDVCRRKGRHIRLMDCGFRPSFFH